MLSYCLRMARVEYRFPLTLWEQTEDYSQQLAAAQARFSSLDGRANSAYLPEVTFTSNCIPVIYRSDQTPHYERRRYSPTEALKSAKRHGTIGYFNVEDLQEFQKGEGIIIDMEMDELGFRRHKKDPSRWVKKQTDEEDQHEARDKHWQELNGTSYDIPDQEERGRLHDLVVAPNIGTKFGATYSVSTGITGLIFIALDVNPFTLIVGDLTRQLAQRAHINREQDGFTIEARNVRLFNSSADTHDSVHVKAIKSDQSVEEVVWPSVTDSRGVVDLAVDLRRRATGI